MFNRKFYLFQVSVKKSKKVEDDRMSDEDDIDKEPFNEIKVHSKLFSCELYFPASSKNRLLSKVIEECCFSRGLKMGIG